MKTGIHPEYHTATVKCACGNTFQTRSTQAEIHTDVPGRIARLLLDLAEESGTNAIEKSLTHQTIAQMIGASRETVSRAMKDFQDAGWITVERRRIALADRPALEQRAQVRV